MELRDAIRGRRSIRAFLDAPLPEGALDALKEAMLWAPSAGNLQARRFVLVRNPDLRKALGAATGQPRCFELAPLVVVGCSDRRIERRYGARGKDLYAVQDVAASVQNLLLTAYSLGLGAVWIGAFREDLVRDALSLEAWYRPVALVPVGVPAETPAPPEHVSEEQAFAIVD